MKKLLSSSLLMAISDFALNGRHEEDRLKGTINGGGPLVMVRASAGNIYLRK
jgi:hypothetical protein